MNFLLAALAKECQKNMLREKILVVPSYQSGHVLCESLSLSGTGWVNLRTETPTGTYFSLIIFCRDQLKEYIYY